MIRDSKTQASQSASHMGVKHAVVAMLSSALILSACGTLSQSVQECEPFPRIGLTRVSEDRAVVEAQLDDGWAFRFRDEETRINEVVTASRAAGFAGSEPWSAGCSTSDLTPVDPLVLDPAVSLSRSTSPDLMRRAYDRSAFWRENSDVWPSPDSLFWFEDVRSDSRFRYECLLPSDGRCFWVAFYLEDIFLVRMDGFSGTEDEVVSYFGELAEQVSAQFNASVASQN